MTVDPTTPWLFWAAAAALVGLGLAFLLVPMLRHRQKATPDRKARAAEAYRQALAELDADRRAGVLSEEDRTASRRALEQRLVAELDGSGSAAEKPARGVWRVALPVALVLPLAAVGLYLALGSPAALQAQGGAAPAPEPAAAPGGADPLAEALPALEAEARQHPGDGEAWLRLAKAYGSLDRYGDAVTAYQRACELVPDRAEAWSGYAEALAITSGSQLEGRPLELVFKALDLNANDPKGLELLGISNYQRGNYTQAAYYWRRLLRQVPADTPFAMDLEGAISEAVGRARAATEGDDAAQPPSAAPEAAPVPLRSGPSAAASAPVPPAAGSSP